MELMFDWRAFWLQYNQPYGQYGGYGHQQMYQAGMAQLGGAGGAAGQGGQEEQQGNGLDGLAGGIGGQGQGGVGQHQNSQQQPQNMGAIYSTGYQQQKWFIRRLDDDLEWNDDDGEQDKHETRNSFFARAEIPSFPSFSLSPSLFFRGICFMFFWFVCGTLKHILLAWGVSCLTEWLI